MKYWGNTKKRIIYEVFPGTGIANNDGNNNTILSLNQVRDSARRIYANRIAFIYIALGYMMSVFGDLDESNNIWLIFLFVMA